MDNLEGINKALETLKDETFKQIISLLLCLGFSIRDIDLISKGLIVKCNMEDGAEQDKYNIKFDEVLSNILKRYSDKDKKDIDFLKYMMDTVYYASKNDLYNILRLIEEADEKFY